MIGDWFVSWILLCLCAHGLQEVRQLDTTLSALLDTTLSALPACLSFDIFRLTIFSLCLYLTLFDLPYSFFHYIPVFYSPGSGQRVSVAL